jgi:hypothetical protein
MTAHYTTLELIDSKYVVLCSAGDLKKKYESRSVAFLACHTHIVRIGIEQLELASAGKEDHD